MRAMASERQGEVGDVRVLLVIGTGPAQGALPALIAALRRRAWSVLPVLSDPAEASCADLWSSLCAAPLPPLESAPAADVVVLAPCVSPLPAGVAALVSRRRAAGVPVVSVPMAPAAAVAGPRPEGAAGWEVVPAALPLLGGGVAPLWLAGSEAVCEAIAAAVTRPDLAGRGVLVTAGPTVEDLDPVRFLSNRSSGLMGLSLALSAWRRGAAVTLVHGPLQVAVPALPGLVAVPVRSAAQMHEAVLERVDAQAVAILCAAVADFAPRHVAEQKIKKTAAGLAEEPSLPLRRTPDILAALGALPRRPFLVGFAAETDHVEAHALDKLRRKGCDLLCANDVTEPGSGFAVATNRITILARDGSITPLPLLSKSAAADRILDRVAAALAP